MWIAKAICMVHKHYLWKQIIINTYNTMKKNLGILLIIIGALLQIIATFVPAMGDLLDQNLYTAGAAVLIIAGLLLHIFINKKLEVDED